MAQKALLFEYKKALQILITCEIPAEAKRLGRLVPGFDTGIWDAKGFEIVKQGNIHKFSRYTAFADYLLSTGDIILVEASPTDTIWGIGFSAGIDRAKYINGCGGAKLVRVCFDGSQGLFAGTLTLPSPFEYEMFHIYY